MIPVRIIDVSLSNMGFMVFLEIFDEKIHDNPKILPLLVGINEGQAILFQVNRFKTERPATSDLIYDILKLLDCKVSRVLIDHFSDQIFHSKIFLKRKNKKIKIDARPSDAILLSLQFNVPIYIADNLIPLANNVLLLENKKYMLYPYQNIDLLKDELKLAIQEENYEKAAEIRDEIKKIIKK